MSAYVVTDQKVQLQKQFDIFINKSELSLGVKFTEPTKALLRLSFEAGFIYGATNVMKIVGGENG